MRKSPDDGGVLRWITETVRPEKARLDDMNARILVMEPQPEARDYFESELQAADPGNTAITRWVDLLDLQEGRLAPH